MYEYYLKYAKYLTYVYNKTLIFEFVSNKLYSIEQLLFVRENFLEREGTIIASVRLLPG